MTTPVDTSAHIVLSVNDCEELDDLGGMAVTHCAPSTAHQRAIRAAHGTMPWEGTTLVLRLTFVAVSVLAIACNGKSPAAPSRPTATTVIISGDDAIRTGLSATYTATATLSDGTTQAVTPTWSNSNTGVASVDSTGRLVGIAHGATILTASHEGRSASKAVQVVNNYEGTWEGRYVIRACDDSGIYEDGVFAEPYTDVPYCQVFQRVGSEHSIKLALSQTGSNQSEIRATLGEDNPAIPGVVTADGRLNLGGAINLLDFEGETVLGVWHVGGWDTNLSGPGVMTGRWSENTVTVTGPVGNVYMENELLTMTRTSTNVTPAPVVNGLRSAWRRSLAGR